MLYFLKWNEYFQHLFLLLKYQYKGPICLLVLNKTCFQIVVVFVCVSFSSQLFVFKKLTKERNSISFPNVRAKSLSKNLHFLVEHTLEVSLLQESLKIFLKQFQVSLEQIKLTTNVKYNLVHTVLVYLTKYLRSFLNICYLLKVFKYSERSCKQHSDCNWASIMCQLNL